MDEARYKEVFGQFLNGYWGAFHELLEAESVTPTRLAGSLFDEVVEEHRLFADTHPASVARELQKLDRLWQRVADRRAVRDHPLTADEVHEALTQFRAIYDTLYAMGKTHHAARAGILADARHAHPRAPLRPDAAS